MTPTLAFCLGVATGAVVDLPMWFRYRARVRARIARLNRQLRAVVGMSPAPSSVSDWVLLIEAHRPEGVTTDQVIRALADAERQHRWDAEGRDVQ